MNIKKILFSLFIVGGGLPFATQAAEEKSALEQDVSVCDWSPVVSKQKANTCAFHAIRNGTLLSSYLGLEESMKNGAQDSLFKSLAAEENSEEFPLSEMQNHIKQEINLDGSQLKKVAIEQAKLNPKHFTVIDSFEDFMKSFENGPMLADEAHIPLYSALQKLKSATPSEPHIFFLGSMNHEKHEGIGHWVTCVANINQDSQKLELHYADSMDPGNVATLHSDKRKKLIEALGVTDTEVNAMLTDNAKRIQQVIEERKTTFTNLIKQLVCEKNPINLLLTSPLGDSLDSVDNTLNFQNSQENALPHLKKAIEYVTDWELLSDPNFMKTRYPDRLKTAIERTLDIDVEDLNGTVQYIYKTNESDLQKEYHLSANAGGRPDTLAGRLARKNQKSWFQKLKSYITPKRLMITSAFCAAGYWLINKLLHR